MSDINPNGKIVDGIVLFKVVTTRIMTSRRGYKMLKVGLHCTDKDGTKRYIPDYIVFGPTTEWKVQSFFKSVGMEKPPAGKKSLYKLKGETGRATVKNMKVTCYLRA